MDKISWRRALYVWHRRIGITTAFFVLFLSVTGLLLHHGERLGFDKAQISASWLLSWYGIEAPQPGPGFKAGGLWLAGLGEDAVAAGTHLHVNAGGSLKGAVELGGDIVAVTESRALLLTGDGQLLESLALPAPPGKEILKAGQAAARLAVETPDGAYATSLALPRWQPLEGEVRWAEPQSLPGDVAERFAGLYRGEGLPLSRILLDMHTGRFFADAGPFVMDLAAIGLIALSLTGIVLWWRLRHF
ncbi:PepSY-associated TM helix [Tepidicaulis marinus]|uniref:PepSY-associated TM helix n=1 Tax=Tepidicaulis marinus TaxID=1333998 RepID=A0A081BDU1_9HYPH|nr:PepSY-associated TM helix domain-containing protein [Tepidicaulis marinus]GAK46209.1 PepSY-associated TM helix [Tepidicaulis marinus]